MVEEEYYPLQRHAGETIRLNEQNECLIHAVGFVVHPAILPTLPPEPKIVEPGTGTGAFLLSIAKEVPGAQLQGFDITDIAFPPPNERPANLTLSIGDIQQPPPVEHVGKYDLVCIRFLNAAFRPGDDWARAANHAFSLLKPGGALQWLEGNFVQMYPILQSHVGDKTEVLDKCTLRAAESLLETPWMTRNLKKVLDSVGFERVDQKVMSWDRDASDRPRVSNIILGAIYGILRNHATNGRPGAWSIEELDRLVPEMKKEIAGGAYLTLDLHQFVAFKPNH